MQHFWYQIKITLREKSSIFWPLIFPIFLGMLFYFMFANLRQIEQFSHVKVGVITEGDGSSDDSFLRLLKETEVEEGVKMFAVTEYQDEAAAEKALEEGEIEGYVQMEGSLPGMGEWQESDLQELNWQEIDWQKIGEYKESGEWPETAEWQKIKQWTESGELQAGGEWLESEPIHMVVAESNTRTTLLKTFLDQYEQNKALIEEMVKKDPAKISSIIGNLFAAGDATGDISIREIPLKGEDKNPYTQYFYALISMTCLIASMLGLKNGIGIQANLSALAARRNVSPSKKMAQVLIDFFASWLLYCIMVFIVLAVVIFGYKQDFGNNAGPILLGACVGSFNGLAAGMMIAVVVKGERRAKEGLCVAYFMISSFLSGLQWGSITYYIEKNCPIINRINPATLVVNAFKSIAVFGDVKQYTVNLLTLLGIGILFLCISIMKLRRTKYASI